MNTRLISTLCCIFLLHLQEVYSQNNALEFDGTNDYVQLANQINVGSTNFTFEAWVKPAVTSNGVVFAQDISGNNSNQLRLTVQNSRARFYFTGSSATPSIDINTPNGSVPLNQWTHLAVVRNGGVVTIYVNGNSSVTGTTATLNNQGGADAARRFRIGARGGSSQNNGQTNFEGMIDDFRYWNVARTAAAIKANLFYPPSASASGLVRWYKFDAGTGTTAVNSGTNNPGNSGTLTNGVTWEASPIVYSQNALHLDGLNDMVALGVPLPTNSSFTKEAWVYATEIFGNLNIISSTSNPFWINGGRLKAGFGGNIEVITDPGTFPLNTWVHVAVTFDDPSNTMRLYRNGTQVAVNTSVSGAYNGENMYIGSWQGTASFFEGRIDEVRIWNVARTAAQILNNSNGEISPPAEANLVSYYTFNQGIVNGTNSGLLTVIDQKGTFNGAVSNFLLLGSASNYVSQYASLAVLPLEWKEFNANKKENQVYLQWTTENEYNTASFVMQHSSDGSRWNDLSTTPAAGTSNGPRKYNYIHRTPGAGANYYRILQTDIDGKFSYSEIRKVIVETVSSSVIIKNNPVMNSTLELMVDKPVTLTIYSMQGSVVIKKQLRPGSQRVNISRLSKGIYVAKAGDMTGKIVVK